MLHSLQSNYNWFKSKEIFSSQKLLVKRQHELVEIQSLSTVLYYNMLVYIQSMISWVKHRLCKVTI